MSYTRSSFTPSAGVYCAFLYEQPEPIPLGAAVHEAVWTTNTRSSAKAPGSWSLFCEMASVGFVVWPAGLAACLFACPRVTDLSACKYIGAQTLRAQQARAKLGAPGQSRAPEGQQILGATG